MATLAVFTFGVCVTANVGVFLAFLIGAGMALLMLKGTANVKVYMKCS